MDDRIEHAEQLVNKADALDRRIDAQTERVINDLVTYKDRAIKWQIAASISMVIMFLMIVVGIFLVVKVRDNATTIKDFCESTNRANESQITLWHFILDLPPDENTTEQQKQLVAQFTNLVDRTFAPHNCSQPAVIP